LNTRGKMKGGGSICNTKCKTNGGKVCWMCILVSIGSARYFVCIWGGGVGAFGHGLTLLGGPIIVSIMLAILYHNLILFDHGNYK
jgi:hypothetical protein